MKVKLPKAGGIKYLFGAFLLGFSAIVPGLLADSVQAAQLTSRSIQMSSSGAGATNVSYSVTFTTSSAMQSLVIDFCKDSPIIGAACDTSATGGSFISASSATLSTPGSLTGWTITPAATTIKLAGSSVSAGNITFTLGNITNPNPTTPGTFYARAYTYANNTFGTYASATSTGNAVDSGGFALSTTNQVSVSGTVAETLVFCTSGGVIGTACSGTTTPSLTLGSGTPATIDSGDVSTGNVYSQISTNAGSGAVIRMKSSSSCGGLMRQGDVTCIIKPVGHTTGSTTASLATAPTPDGLFGVKASSTGSTGTLTTAAPYNTADYGFDAVTSNDNVTSTYGDTVASSTGILDSWNTTYTFAVRPSATTPAGVYAANISLIATGTY